VAREWAQKDPAAAAKLVMRLPEGEDGDFALGYVTVLWAGKDPAAASEWALTLPGEARDKALGDLAKYWSQSDAVAFKKWLEGQLFRMRKRKNC